MSFSSFNTMAAQGLICHDLSQEKFWSMSNVTYGGADNDRCMFSLTWKPSTAVYNYIVHCYNQYKEFYYKTRPGDSPFMFQLFKWFTTGKRGRHSLRKLETTIDYEQKSFILNFNIFYLNLHDCLKCFAYKTLIAQRICLMLRLPFFTGIINGTAGSGRWRRRYGNASYDTNTYPLFQKFTLHGYVSSDRGLYNRKIAEDYDQRIIAPLTCHYSIGRQYKQWHRGRNYIKLCNEFGNIQQINAEGDNWGAFIQKNKFLGFYVYNDYVTNVEHTRLIDATMSKSRFVFVRAVDKIYNSHIYTFVYDASILNQNVL